MRLRTALEASRCVGEPLLVWWDAATNKWVREGDVSIVGQPPPRPALRGSGSSRSFKRALFPSTLFESGRRAIRAFSSDSVLRDTTVVLHTSYLSPISKSLRESGVRRIIVDVYDFVAYAHLDDAEHNGALGMLRKAYGTSVRHRELGYLAQADGLAVAGWRDTQLLATAGLTQATWVPTGIQPLESSVPSASPICVGLIGNFAHSATAAASSLLLGSELASSPDCRLIFAGLHSDSLVRDVNATVLGPVADARSFYDEIHVLVVPVQNSSGMKCKLAEGVLARKAVLTTPRGAAGYPPSLRKYLEVAPLDEMSVATVRHAMESHDPEGREVFEATCGLPAAADSYGSLLQAYG
jgi:hypothetical protein